MAVILRFCYNVFQFLSMTISKVEICHSSSAAKMANLLTHKFMAIIAKKKKSKAETNT